MRVDGADYSVKLIDVSLEIRKIRVIPSISLVHEVTLEEGLVKWKSFIIPAGNLSLRKDHIFNGLVPKFLRHHWCLEAIKKHTMIDVTIANVVCKVFSQMCVASVWPYLPQSTTNKHEQNRRVVWWLYYVKWYELSHWVKVYLEVGLSHHANETLFSLARSWFNKHCCER